LRADRPHDEELVAVVENDSCAVDAIQFLTGCTFGKGNLVFRDHGKHVYTFYNRKAGQGIRISEDFRGFEGDARFSRIREREQAGEDMSQERKVYLMEKAAAILKADEKDLLSFRPVSSSPPQEAKIRTSLRCAVCGEKFMESRGRVRNGKIVCLPCSEGG
jgi:formylmethanofuran dehydrogenase subunit E